MSFEDRSEHAVWTQKTKSGNINRVFVMYHATRPEAASQIIRGGGNFK